MATTNVLWSRRGSWVANKCDLVDVIVLVLAGEWVWAIGFSARTEWTGSASAKKAVGMPGQRERVHEVDECQ